MKEQRKWTNKKQKNRKKQKASKLTRTRPIPRKLKTVKGPQTNTIKKKKEKNARKDERKDERKPMRKKKQIKKDGHKASF